MTSPLFVTIDSQKTLDIDDAISITQSGDLYIISVAIADPSAKVGVGSHDDKVAFERAASIYARDRAVQTMLPRHIGADQSSLVAGQPRQAMVFTITLNSSLEVVGFEPSSQVITVNTRLTYEAIPEIARGTQNPLREMVELLSRVSTLLLQRRRSKGALALFDIRKLMLSDEEGNLRQYESLDQMVGHIIVQEFMILTNSQIALFMAENGLPAVYRNHASRVSAPHALDLANTVEQWLKEGLVTASSVGAQLGALIERAVYDGVARGHYGLGLTLYLHGTSPLRRYADLVNIRQIRAYLDNCPLPYSQADLLTISASINKTLRERSESTVDYHKEVLARKAQRLVASGNLANMEDNVLSAAVKLAKDAGHLPEAVAAELIRRLNNNTIADAIVDRLAIQIPKEAITEDLGAAFSNWMCQHPHNVVRIIMNGIQTQVFEGLDETVHGVNGGFKCVVAVSASGRRLQGVGVHREKRVAKQKAMVEILCRHLSLPTNSLSPEAPTQTSSSPATRATDYKGALIELCRKQGWAAPHLHVAMSGPSNAASFTATATVHPKGSDVESATSPECATKKAAEAAASAILLKRLAKSREATSVSSSNPVVQLNEMAQKNRLAEPSYVFTQLSIAPPQFECEARIVVDGNVLSAKTVAGGKKVAKELAAAEILGQVKIAS
ncbi:TPA: RNB domain-containing ribonuclease [Pseudomonas putida]|uniref:RNB domain-containing ribonuclease n=1 Tax=Pseudomonas TaxID=286 RepID=UPI0015EF7C1D|nr:RNB domain-containing ribonuclease [Pseudomonas monteilii]MCE0946533.1 RNB domain-containing ribonuclease [Pseudomonas asiatica]MCE1004716.1 RNB domain-containing ribonuclease [Pseudomonas sp. NMI1173_11]MCE1067297.1 RNB domain-containing ribonuclease [Pseudomonas asiatica]